MSEVPRPRLVVFQAQRILFIQELASGQAITAGRMPDCDMVLQHHTVSRMHACFVHDEQGVYIEDLGSANGTFVDGRRVMGRQKLQDGQIVLLGQRTSASPILIRFEDPAARLLKEMGILESGTEPTEAENATTPAAPSEEPAASSVKEAQPAPEQAAEPAAETQNPRRFPVLPQWMRSPHVIGAIILGFLALVISTLWLVRTLKPTPSIWRSVQVLPQQVQAGSELVLQSPDIRSSNKIKIRLADRAVTDFVLETGRLRIRVPELEPGPGGPHAMPLTISLHDIPVVNVTVQYLVMPRIKQVIPGSTQVGDSIEIQGTGFTRGPAQVRVYIGHQPAPVLTSTPLVLKVRVPSVTKRNEVRVPVRVQIGELTAEAPDLLSVRPRQIKPLKFQFSARHIPQRRAWEIRHLFGVVTDLSTGVATGTELPEPVLAVIHNFEKAMKLLTQDPASRFGVDTRDSQFFLVVESRTSNQTLVLLAWTRKDLARMVRNRALDVSPEMVPYWMASVWNDLTRVFLRGEPLEEHPGAPAYVKILNKLIQINLQAGGNGRPELQDFALLDEKEKRVLEYALLDVEPHFGNLSGAWTADLENIFYPNQNYRVRLILEFRQSRTKLRGTAVIRFESPRLKWNPRKKTLSGSVILGSPIRTRFRIPFDSPVGPLTFQGSVAGGRMEGSFRSQKLHRMGTWTGVLEKEARASLNLATTRDDV